MMIGLRELNWGGCQEGESSEPMPALTLGQGVEQNLQRVIRNSTNDKIGIWSHGGINTATRPGGMSIPRKAPNKANCPWC